MLGCCLLLTLVRSLLAFELHIRNSKPIMFHSRTQDLTTFAGLLEPLNDALPCPHLSETSICSGICAHLCLGCKHSMKLQNSQCQATFIGNSSSRDAGSALSRLPGTGARSQNAAKRTASNSFIPTPAACGKRSQQDTEALQGPGSYAQTLTPSPTHIAV